MKDDTVQVESSGKKVCEVLCVRVCVREKENKRTSQATGIGDEAFDRDRECVLQVVPLGMVQSSCVGGMAE